MDFVLTNEDNAPSRQDEDRRNTPRPRVAKVTSRTTTLSQVRAYLPSGYDAIEIVSPEAYDTILIVGYDAAGWTLDGYVLPRLASGLIFATEVK